MQLAIREELTARALAEGFDEIVARDWPPMTVLAAHIHLFALKAIVIAG